MTTAPPGERFPPIVARQRQLYRLLTRQVDRSELAIARHFRDFTRAIQGKLTVLAAPFALDEYADAVDEVLGADLVALNQALAFAVSIVLRESMAIGAAQAQTQIAGIVVDWDVRRPDVDRAIRDHAGELVRGLNTTTRERLATVLRAGVREGKSVAEIARDIEVLMRDMSRRRARVIAATEVVRGYNAGSVSLYRESGVVSGLRWIDRQAGACPFCQSLDGKIIRIDGEFSVTIEGATVSAPYPPAHPSCRCTVAPVLIGTAI